jgi:hypothetical protein
MSSATKGKEIVQAEGPGESVVPIERDPQSLIRLAIERDVSVDALERIVALAERVSDRNARSAFFDALSRFQAECGEVPQNKTASLKTKSGANFKFRYTSLDALTRHVRPILAKHGLSYTWDTEIEGKVAKVTATIRHVDGYEQTASFAAPIESYGADMSTAQDTAKVTTFAKRQSLFQALGVASTDDDEAALAATGAQGRQKVNAGQVADLEALIEEVGADRGKFLQWLDVTSLDELDMTMYHNAVQALERKRQNKDAPE